MALSPSERARAARSARLQAQYNITADEWDRVYAFQGGICAICKRAKNEKGSPLIWNTDHDHKTGETRGLLCVYCNKRFSEFWTLERLKAAVAYLENSPVLLALGERRYGRKGRVTNKRRRRTTRKKK